MDQWNDVLSYGPQFLSGLKVTMEVTLYSLLLSMAIGVVIAILRVSSTKVFNAIGVTYVEFFQNTPLIIQVFFIYFGTPALGVKLSGFTCGTIGLALYTGAYIGEVFRAGIQAVPKGQMEAARSSGMSYLQAMGYVVLPQAVKIVLPPLANQVVNMVKNSAILSTIVVADLMYETYRIASETFIIFEVFIFAALLYLVITVPLSTVANLLEQRLRRSS
ncbi:ABC transporter permease subunit [Heliobacterium gestii]|uniref:ABC transporter permease subunit n=1 Tax=Heliomicrobium gestii TaxID=2699 RepID=A0A845LFJ8_HELGE|nr:amino acid ABC transporter permease [Heliomicrobium gestii]MBM7868181.1 putative glutamine transport system permease protein [Heliomicrobium gestii]MZP43379.1 ABC transporter permease subunit [Heliomicrobium gestii]